MFAFPDLPNNPSGEPSKLFFISDKIGVSLIDRQDSGIAFWCSINLDSDSFAIRIGDNNSKTLFWRSCRLLLNRRYCFEFFNIGICTIYTYWRDLLRCGCDTKRIQ